MFCLCSLCLRSYTFCNLLSKVVQLTRQSALKVAYHVQITKLLNEVAIFHYVLVNSIHFIDSPLKKRYEIFSHLDNSKESFIYTKIHVTTSIKISS
jgi:hypothetical protein